MAMLWKIKIRQWKITTFFAKKACAGGSLLKIQRANCAGRSKARIKSTSTLGDHPSELQGRAASLAPLALAPCADALRVVGALCAGV